MAEIQPKKIELYLQTRSQYNSNIFNASERQKEKPNKLFQYLKKIDDIQKKTRKLNIESLIACIIQTTYLKFTAYCYKADVEIQNYYYDQRQTKIKSKSIGAQPINMYAIYKVKNISQQNNQSSKIISQIKTILKKLQYFENSHNEQIIKNFENQFDRLIDLHDQKQIDIKKFLLCLEQTQLFRKHSLLLKIKNASIFNVIKPRQFINQNQKQQAPILKKLLEIRVTQNQEVDHYHKLRKQNRPEDKQQINKLQVSIENNLKKFFETCLKPPPNCVKYIPVEPTSTDDSYKVKFYLRYHQKNVQIAADEKKEKLNKEDNQKKMTFEKQVLNITNKLLKTDNNNNNANNANKIIIPLTTQQFFVEYSNQRNSISVKLITDIQLNVQTSDFLMFQSNNLSFDSSNITLELVQKTVGANKVRFLAFKGNSCFSQKQAPIEKILLLMDLAIVSFKVLQPEVTKSVIGPNDYLKPKQLHKKINHYSSIISLVTNLVYSLEPETLQ